MMRAIGRFIREKPAGAAGAIVFLVMILLSIIGPYILPYDPTLTNLSERMQAPSWMHIMGTDWLGRDLFSRIILGARTSMLVGVSATLFGTTVGALLGLISGYLGGRVDLFMQRISDMLMAFPALILAMAIMAVLGASVTNVIIAIAVPTIPRANRVVRSIAQSVREYQFIEAAQAVGARPTRVIFHHVLPNCSAAYMIVATAMLGSAIMIEASLSFLGIGMPPPDPSWGRSLSAGMEFFRTGPWLIIFPSLAIAAVVFAANMLGDALRDIWDPRLKQL